MQMRMKCATIPLCLGETRRLYREARYAYVLSELISPIKYLIYIVEEDMGWCMLSGGNDYDKTRYPMIVVNHTKHS